MGMGPEVLDAVKYGKEIQNSLKFGNKVMAAAENKPGRILSTLDNALITNSLLDLAVSIKKPQKFCINFKDYFLTLSV